jgi:hypothetical protein|tara:strand:+ start:1007 stop:1360 length:354 start_codon:yes stop_codon:yes gene_type:complete
MTIDTKTLPEQPFTISYDTSTPSMAPSNNDYSISFDATTNYASTVTASSPISINIDKDALGTEWHRKTFDKWPSEVVIEDMIKKYPGLKLQYEKFKTVYDLVKDDYTYEEPEDDGSV